MTLLPNPVRNSLFVMHDKAAKNASISVITISGSKITTIQVAEESIQTTVNTSALVPGNYILRYESNGVVESKSFVKTN